MGRTLLDPEALASFACGLELGSFARAAERLHRSTSAVSAQLKKLEEQLGTPVLQKNGRGLEPTPAGEILLGYARRLLELNDEAVLAVRGVALSGSVRLGLAEDFGEGLLPMVLGRFARSCPDVHVEVRVGRSESLRRQIAAGELDLAVAWDSGLRSPFQQELGRLPLHWIASPLHEAAGKPLPLVLFDSPCLVRQRCCAELDQAGVPWRVTVSGSSLAALWAAVRAGLGLGVRTRIGLAGGLEILDPAAHGLPPLPEIGLLLLQAEAKPKPPAQRLQDLVREQLLAMLPASA